MQHLVDIAAEEPPPRFARGRPVVRFPGRFFGGLLQLYNLAARGLSLRILIDAAESRGQALTLARVMTHYSTGRGIAWMYQKRIDDMVNIGRVVQRGSKIDPTARGVRLACVFAWLPARLNFPVP